MNSRKSKIIIKDFLGRIQLNVWFEGCLISKFSDLLPEETGKVNKGAIFNKLVQHEMNVPDKKEI